MKLLSLETENVKRVRAVAFTLKDGVTLIEGRNANGKTSVVDSIWYALAGAGVHPPEVLRRGAEKGGTVLRFDEFTVDRKYTPKSTSLHVTMADGKKVASPQGFLDALCRAGGLAFDPVAFLSYKRADQVEIVRKLAGLDFAAHDQLVEAKKLKKSEANREGHQLVARVKAFAPDPADLPAKPVDVDELLEQRSKLEAQRDENQKARASAHYANLEEANRAREVHDARQTVGDARARLEAAEHRLAEVTATHARAKEAANLAGVKLEQLVDPDVAGVDEKLRGAQAINQALLKRTERQQIEKELTEKRAEHAKLEAEVEQLEAKKREELRTAKYPIEGLGFGLDGLTFLDVPFEQASEAERLRVGMAIGLALNPKLKLVLIRSGSQIDNAGLELIGKLAEASGSQVIIERVAEGPTGAGFYIEDGRIGGSDEN